MANPDTEVPPSGPLAGLRVIDCSTVLAGPLCTMVLGDLGADIVKIEPPDGDGTRAWGPPWVGRLEDGTRTAAYFLAVNRNKRSIRLDLRTDAGRAVLRRLLERADVFVENFRPGALARFGLDDAALGAINPRLVHLAISGFGMSGPGAGRPGYDLIVQAAGGLMSITGATDAEGGGPTKVGVAISDVTTGLFGAIAILGSLLATARAAGQEPSGAGAAGGLAQGRRIDVTLLGATLALLVNQAQNAFVSGRAPGRGGNTHPSIVPYQAFATADRTIAVAVGSERQWVRFCEAIERADLAADPRFATNGDRVEHRNELIAILTEAFAADIADRWLARLDAADVPCAPIHDVLAAFDDPVAQALGMRQPVEHPVIGRVDQVGIPFRLADGGATIRMPPPLLGEHTDEVLAELGYDEAAIADLRGSSVV